MKIGMFYLFVCCSIWINSSEIQVFVDDSDGMEGFSNSSAFVGKVALYPAFFNSLELRLGNNDLDFKTIQLYKLNGKPVQGAQALKDCGIDQSNSAYNNVPGSNGHPYYVTKQTNLIHTLNLISSRIIDDGGPEVILLVSDMILSTTKGKGFDITAFRNSIDNFLMNKNLGYLSIIGVKSEFCCRYFSQSQKGQSLVRFAEKGRHKETTRPFFIWIIGKQKSPKAELVHSALIEELNGHAATLDVEKTNIQNVILHPVEEYLPGLNLSFPGVIRPKQLAGYYFSAIKQKKVNHYHFYQKDPVPLNSNDELEFSLIAPRGKPLSWIRSECVQKDLQAFSNKTKKQNATEFLKYTASNNTFAINLHKVSQEIVKEKFIIKGHWNITHKLPSQGEPGLWWRKWSTNNDFKYPHNALYLENWMETIMGAVLAKRLVANNKAYNNDANHIQLEFYPRANQPQTYKWQQIFPYVLGSGVLIAMVFLFLRKKKHGDPY